MGFHPSASPNLGVANAFFRAGMIESWGRGVGDIVRAVRECRNGDAALGVPGWVLLEPVLSCGNSLNTVIGHHVGAKH